MSQNAVVATTVSLPYRFFLVPISRAIWVINAKWNTDAK